MRYRGVLAILLIALTSCADVSFIEHITFTNNGDFPAHVEVRDTERSGWLGIGTALPNDETSFREVIDQGETWIFRFDYVGEHYEELEVSRASLERSDWRVGVPAEFDAALRELGFSPPP